MTPAGTPARLTFGLLTLWPVLALASDGGVPMVELDPSLVDPLELARRVDAAGDAKVLSALKDRDRARRLAGIAAAPHMGQSALALTPLCELLGGRDPELAPAAAASAAEIASRLQLAGLAAQDLTPDQLARARRALAAALAQSWLRADLRRLALGVDYALSELGVPAPPSEPS